MSDLFFWSMLAIFFTHELDAVRRHEWRVLPGLRALPEAIGAHLFVWLHVPLFLGVFWLTRAGADAPFAQALSGFAIVHVYLHWIFRHHPANEFNNLGSWGLISGAGTFGALHLGLEWTALL